VVVIKDEGKKIHRYSRRKVNTADIEIAVSKYFDYRKNLIVPNVSWGLGLHECDLLILSKSGYLTEVEIKISKYDLKADLKKRHKHRTHKVKYLFFAVPHYLEEEGLRYKPENAGLIIVAKSRVRPGEYVVSIKKEARANSYPYCVSERERLQMARLGTMRIWSLKEKLNKMQRG
jgi:hypothetical protein